MNVIINVERSSPERRIEFSAIVDLPCSGRKACMGARFPVVESCCADWLDFGLAGFGQCQVALVQRDIQVTVNSIALDNKRQGLKR